MSASAFSTSFTSGDAALGGRLVAALLLTTFLTTVFFAGALLTTFLTAVFLALRFTGVVGFLAARFLAATLDLLDFFLAVAMLTSVTNLFLW
ncbi:MAG: hypothetical protein AB7T07_04600 [Steroidobacteraceae bacterium]